MSRTLKPTWWPFRKRSKLGQLGRRSRRPLAPAVCPARHLHFEGLESRTLLSISAFITAATSTSLPAAHFVSDSLSDELYLSTDTNGDLEYATGSGGTESGWITNFGSAGTFSVQTQDVEIDTEIASADQVSSSSSTLSNSQNGVFLQGISTDGRTMSIVAGSTGSSNQLMQIQGTVDTKGGGFTVNGFSNVIIGTPSGEVFPQGPATISTRNIGTSTDYLSAPSMGNSGALSVTVANSDPFNPFLNTNFNTPQITVENGSRLLAQASGSFVPGNITLKAANTNFVISGLSFPSLGFTVRQSTVEFEDGTAASHSTVQGGAIDIEANSGDISAQSEATSKTDTSSDDQFTQLPQWFGAFLNTGLQLASYIPGLSLLTLPLAVDYRNAASTVTLGQYTQIDASGDVTLNSTSTADAEGQAIYTYNTQVGLAVAVMIGVTDAETNVNNNASINSTGGAVTIASTANTTALATARVGQNINGAPDDSNNVAIAACRGRRRPESEHGGQRKRGGRRFGRRQRHGDRAPARTPRLRRREPMSAARRALPRR